MYLNTVLKKHGLLNATPTTLPISDKITIYKHGIKRDPSAYPTQNHENTLAVIEFFSKEDFPFIFNCFP